MKSKLLWLFVFCVAVFVANGFGQRARQGKVCGNPNIRCRNEMVVFSANDLNFETPKGAVIYESKPFYAVVLESARASDRRCKEIFNEERRLGTQKLFPNNKVFTFLCDEAELIYYTGVSNGTGFMAVYAGDTLAQAQKFLKTVQNTLEFRKAYVRKMQVNINGT